MSVELMIILSKSHLCQRYLNKFYSWMHLKILSNTAVLEIKIWVIDYNFLSFQTHIICKYPLQKTGMNIAFANETFVPELRV